MNSERRQGEGYKKAGAAIWESHYRPRKTGEWPNYCLLKHETEYPDISPYSNTHKPPRIITIKWGGSAALCCVNS